MPTSRAANEGKPVPDVRVHIVNAAGQFLASHGDELFFSDQRHGAVVLSYEADRVEEQLEALRRTQGIELGCVPVPLEEIYETCDGCHELFMPFMTVFDGQRFLCGECVQRFSRRPNRRVASDA